MNNEYLNKRKKYYTTKGVIFELLKCMRDREVVFMDRKENWKCIRGLWYKSKDFLLRDFDRFHFFERDYNIYISVARYRLIPPFPYDLTIRSKFTKEWFETEGKKNQYAYDFLFDFDEYYKKKEGNKTKIISNRHKQLKEILDFYNFIRFQNQDKEKYYIIPSGHNFQIVVYNERLSNEEVQNATIGFKDNLNLNYLCMAGIGNPFKLMKCPYSLVSDLVCFPLFDVNLDTLNNYSYFDSNNILKKENIGFRGVNYATIL